MEAPAVPAETVEPGGLKRWLENKLEADIRIWLGAVHRFTRHERARLLDRNPTAVELAEHRQALKTLMFMGNMFALSADHPEFWRPDFTVQVRAARKTLADSWAIFHEPDPEAEALARQLAPELYADESRA